jgi:hypothetical protein
VSLGQFAKNLKKNFGKFNPRKYKLATAKYTAKKISKYLS